MSSLFCKILLLYKKRIHLFLETNCYSLFITNSVFASLFLCYRLFSRNSSYKSIWILFFNLHPVFSNWLDVFFFCFLPSLGLFLYLEKKPLLFFLKPPVLFGYINKKFTTIFLLIAKIECYHCDSLSVGLAFYLFNTGSYILLDNCCSDLTVYCTLSLIKYFIYLYVNYRSCFFNPNNLYIIKTSPEFTKMFGKLQQPKMCANRIFFVQIYFLFFFLNIFIKKAQVIW